jgi:hypothetical protein
MDFDSWTMCRWVINSSILCFSFSISLSQRATVFTIQLGSNTLEGADPNRVKVSSSEYVVHSDYNSLTLENDIGLIKLRIPVEYSSKNLPENTRLSIIKIFL